MKRYIAFLRGINVSGKNTIAMPVLKQAMRDYGYQDVVTYINSGNVVFLSDVSDINVLKRDIETLIKDTFALDIPTRIISVNALQNALSQAPSWWGDGNKEIIHYCLFVIPPSVPALVTDFVNPLNPDIERLEVVDDIIFWSAPHHIFTKSKLSKTAISPFNNHITIRNANTVRKMVDLALNDS